MTTEDISSPEIREKQDIEKLIVRVKELMHELQRPVLVALDGRSGTGKSTIAKRIASQLGGVEITADDFWVGGKNSEWDAKNPQERAEQAIDWRRIRNEVLEPLLAGRQTSWHPFNWKAGEGLAEDTIDSEPKPLIVLDGAYSARPELSDIIDLAILVEVHDDDDRRSRLVNRENADYMAAWHARWDPAEDYYFTNVRPRGSFDMVISNSERFES
jgi:uridine kinase